MARRKLVPSRAHINAIGDLVVNMTRLESVILDLLGIAMGTDVLRTVIGFAPQQFASKVDTLRAILSLNTTKDERNADALLRKLKIASDLGEYRNRLVHGYWAINSKGETLAVRFYSRGVFERKRFPTSAQEIHEKSREARALETELRALRNHLQKNAQRQIP